MKEPKRVSRGDIEIALAELDEPLASPVFNSWSFEPLLEYLEQTLKQGKKGLPLLRASGFVEASVGCLTEPALVVFKRARTVGTQLYKILDRVERDPRRVNIEDVRFVLRRWRRFVPA